MTRPVARLALQAYSDRPVNAIRPRPERSSQLMAAILLAFVLAMLALHVGQPLHLHKGTTPGAYNEEHVLASLESVIGDVPLPDQAPSLPIALATERTVPLRDRQAAPGFARHRDSRAPPLV